MHAVSNNSGNEFIKLTTINGLKMDGMCTCQSNRVAYIRRVLACGPSLCRDVVDGVGGTRTAAGSVVWCGNGSQPLMP